MKDKQLRKAVKELSNRLGISYDYNSLRNEIDIGRYSSIDGGDPEKIPLSRGDIMRFLNRLTAKVDENSDNFRMLLKYLKLEMHEGKEIRKIKKILET